MLLKNLSFACIMLLGSSTILAQESHNLDIKKATVFLEGAELSCEAQVSLKKGDNEIVFTNVASKINGKSLNVGVGNDVVVLSAFFKKDYLNEDKPPAIIKLIDDSITFLSNKHNLLQNRVNVISEQFKLVDYNRQISGDQTNLTVAELSKMLTLYDTALNKLYDQKTILAKQINSIRNQVKRLKQQKEEEYNKNSEPSGQIVVKFYSKKAVTATIKVSYIVPEAGWVPAYDLRVAKVNAPVELTYKGHVYQNCGIDWDNIKLTLSAGNPTEGVQAPVLNTWYLKYDEPKFYSYEVTRESTTVTKSSEELDRMPTRNTTSTVASTGGALDEISIGGARDNGTLYYIDGVQVYGSRGINMSQGAIEDVNTYRRNNTAKYAPTGNIGRYVATENQGVNTTFDIDIPYTIPNNKKEVLVAIKTVSLNAKYRYYAVPKIDKDVFLQAMIADWEDLDLLPAQTNIFYEGTYVGQGYIDTRNAKDTMSISLGRDKKILVKRERDKMLKTVRSIGSNTKELFVYKLDVRNTRQEQVELVLYDQVPVSNFKSIVVDDIEYDDAVFNETTGKAVWKCILQPNEAIEKKIKYTVKYPKYRLVEL